MKRENRKKADTKATIPKREVIYVDAGKRYQKWEGFGTSLMWWANAIQGFDRIPATEDGRCQGYASRYEELLGMLFDPVKGLGLNIVRYNIGGGDCGRPDFITRCGARIPGYLKEDGRYDWTADEMQIRVLRDAWHMIKETRQNFYNTVFSVSPPWFMTCSGSSTGSRNGTDDNLRWDQYDAFVDYFLNVTEYIREELGIPVTEIEPVNEPVSGYWKYGSSKQEGCQFNRYPQPEVHRADYDPQREAYDPALFSALSRIFEMTGRELVRRQEQGKLKSVTICGTDETSIDEAGASFLALTEEARGYIAKIAVHEYGGDRRRELRQIAEDYGKKLWMSEICYQGGKWDPESMNEDCFRLGRDIRKDIYEMGATGWVAWQGIEGLAENLLWDSNWGFVHCLYEEPAWKCDPTERRGEEKSPEERDRNAAKCDPTERRSEETCAAERARPGCQYGLNRRHYCLSERRRITPEDLKARGLRRGDYFKTKQYYAWGQYTRYLKENDVIIDVSDPDFVAAVSPRGNIVLIAVNQGSEARMCRMELRNAGKVLSVSGTCTDKNRKWAEITEGISFGDGWAELTLAPESISAWEIPCER